MDVTEIKQVTEGTLEISLAKENGRDNFLMIVAYYDDTEDRITLRVDNYRVGARDPIAVNMKGFRDSMDREGIAADSLEGRRPDAPNPPYTLPPAPPPRQRGYYA